MTDKHTPGPWRDTGYAIVSPDGVQLARIDANTAPTLTETECDANARLIAAAPELLAALRTLVEAFGDCDDQSVITPARAAIAKATGGAP